MSDRITPEQMDATDRWLSDPAHGIHPLHFPTAFVLADSLAAEVRACWSDLAAANARIEFLMGCLAPYGLPVDAQPAPNSESTSRSSEDA